MKKNNTLLALLTLPAIALFGTLPGHADGKDQKNGKKHEHGEHSHEAHAGHMLEGYISITEALYKDDLRAAKKAAKGMIKHDKKSALAAPASEIAKAKNLAAAREAFKSMSAKAVKMAESSKDGKYTVMHCPMVKGGAGDWLSADGKVNNPYFGSKMAHCGGPKK